MNREQAGVGRGRILGRMGILEGYCDLTTTYCSHCRLLLVLAALLAMIVCLGMVDMYPKEGKSNKLRLIAVVEKGWKKA